MKLWRISVNEIKAKDVVLFVDDEHLMHQSIRRGLLNEPYEQLFADSGHTALKILESHDVSVMVTDLKMPEMDGIELLKIVAEKYPDITRIVLTGYYQVSNILQAINSGHIHRYLTKPWKMEEEFIPTVRQAIEYHHIIKHRKQLIAELTKHNENLTLKNKEILQLKELAETSDQNKTKILNHLTITIIPFMMDVILNTDKLKESKSTTIQDIALDLNKRGMEILRLLRKLELLLQGKKPI
jgi:response regulator RpfG family c-di-GMP phosphodiesterase